MLATYETGAGEPPLLIAPGLFGSARNLGAIAKRLGDARRVVSVDMRNHGASPWFDSHTYEDMASDLAEVIGDGCWDVMGHSMGGKAAMMLALTRPEKVRRLIVADIAPVAYRHTQRHLIEAMRAVDLDQVETRRDADRLLSEHVQDPGVRAFLLQSLDVKGRCWTLNLDVLEREMNRIIGWPEIDAVFEGPAFFIAGGNSSYVKSEYRDDIRRYFPEAKVFSLPGAGHWLHAEKPREFEASIRVVLD